MQEEYNCSLILKIAAIPSLIEAYIFYSNLGGGWQYFSLVIALLLTGIAVYMKDKKKNNIFTAVGFVFLVALLVKFLRNFGII